MLEYYSGLKLGVINIHMFILVDFSLKEINKIDSLKKEKEKERKKKERERKDWFNLV